MLISIQILIGLRGAQGREVKADTLH